MCASVSEEYNASIITVEVKSVWKKMVYIGIRDGSGHKD
jgi:hypothetical protein